MKDPFYRQIVDALEAKEFSWKVFQRCMGDLLRDSLPGLVPIIGSSDGGIDGAVADGKGTPYTLVCTTDKRVIRNLTENLKSRLARDDQRRLAVLATSVALKPRVRENLEKRAAELGFTLLQIFDQPAIADRLFDSPRWCRELLGIAWSPQALSSVPPPGRAQLEIELIGRDADVEWLRSTTGDRLITGQPGSGKTYLLRHLAREGWGVFLRSDDPGAIRNGLIEQKPSVVIVDDAHVVLHRIQLLRELRQEVEQEFAIVATCGEGERAAVAAALEFPLPDAQIRRLELLTRDQIVEIFRQAGVRASNDVLKHLVTQAANKPGLAVTLAIPWLRSAWPVLGGEALAPPLVDEGSREFLAVLGVGGDRGMSFEIAGEFLGIGLLKAYRLASRLAAGGMLFGVEEGMLAVKQEALRSYLIRETFFEGPVNLDYKSLVERAPSFESAVAAIVTAAGYGAKIPAQELRGLVERCTVSEGWKLSSRLASKVWRRYASLGEDEAHWAIEHYPGNLMDIAWEALGNAPRATIPRLLEEAAENKRAKDPFAAKPLDLLRFWLQDLSAEARSPGELIARRKLAIRLARQYVDAGGARGVAIRVLGMALSPRIESTSRDPGKGMTVETIQGILPPEQLEELRKLWGEGRSLIDELSAEAWMFLKDAFWNWLRPETVTLGRPVQSESREILVSLALQVFRDVAPLAEGSWGLTAGLVRLMSRFDLEVPLRTDPLFDLLFPPDYLGDRHEREEKERAELRKLAERWNVNRQPEEVAETLLRYEDEAKKIGQQYPRHIPEFCGFLAEQVSDPLEWATIFIDQNLPGDSVRPFLEKISQAQPEGWVELFDRCLDLEAQAWNAMFLILRSEDPPVDLLEKTLARSTSFPALSFPKYVEHLALRNEIPLTTLQAIFSHSDSPLALAAALGEKQAFPDRPLRKEICSAARRAILLTARGGDGRIDADSAGLGHGLREVLANDPELASEWLAIFLDSDPDSNPESWDAARAAIKALDEERRCKILEALRPGRFAEYAIPEIVGRRVGVYRRLLDLDRLRRYHLCQLTGRPDEEWKELAKVALAKGYEPERLVQVLRSAPHPRVGFGRQYWTPWMNAFAKLESDPDEGIREVAQLGREWVQEELEVSAEFKKHVELHGV